MHSYVRGKFMRVTHGYSRKGNIHPLYVTWVKMRKRCNNEKDKDYHSYGARGIKVCARWEESFVNFLEDMGDRPKGHSLDRVDNDLGYSKENCKWSTPTEQSRNTRRSIDITFGSATRNLSYWCEFFGMSHETVSWRIKKRGYSPQMALTTPCMMSKKRSNSSFPRKN